MCGILLTTRGKSKPEILDSIKHRGIESSKETFPGPTEVTLCHHRLPIQTLDGDDWNQPIELSEGVYLMFNGEIFNYDTNLFESDTEYLCNLFSKYQGGNIEFFAAMYVPHIVKWDGFWAIVIYNSKTGDVISFTDPLGKKCLYRNELGEICSEIKGLYTQHSDIDQKFISSVRKWGYNKDNRTAYTNIKRLLPNNIYSHNINSPMFESIYPEYYRAWDLPIPELKDADYEAHINWLWDKMFESVGNRLVSRNYPISILVSGGLDSSIIAAVLKEMEAKVKWFSIENGETPFINDLSAHLDTPVTFLDYDMDSEKNGLIYALWNESPIDLGSVIPQYHLFEAIRKNTDYRIVISGDGSDELFGGYSRIHEYDSQKSDTFEELPFYHLPRLDKMSMAHTLELRSPFLNLDIVRFAMHLPLEWRKDKKILKDTFGPMLPESIVNRKKEALKNPEIKEDKLAYRQKAVDLFLSIA
jgi:asparagine synthase (glutamine-hydrolysing)